MSLFREARPRIARVVTLEVTRVLIVSDEAYWRLVNDTQSAVSERIEKLVLKQLTERLVRLDDQIQSVAEGHEDPYAEPPPTFWSRLRGRFGGERKVAPTPRSVDAMALLVDSPLFFRERPAFVASFASQLTHVAVAAGTPLVEQGAGAGQIGILAAGRADVVVRVGPGRIETIGSVGAGAALGMTSVLRKRPRSATVIATEPVDILVMSAERAAAILGDAGQLAACLRRALIRATAEQVDAAGHHLVQVGGVVPSHLSAGASLEINLAQLHRR